MIQVHMNLPDNVKKFLKIIFESGIILMPPLLEKDKMKKENYRSDSIINRNVKILNKILAIIFPEKKKIKRMDFI